jgi:hypothetical protein
MLDIRIRSVIRLDTVLNHFNFENHSPSLHSLVDAQAGIGEITHVFDRTTGLLNLAVGHLSGSSFFTHEQVAECRSVTHL